MGRDGENSNRASDSNANLEPDTSHGVLGKKEAQRPDSPVRITFLHVRKTLVDIDNLSGKAAIDGLVKAGILKDDSPKFVSEVTHKQYQGEEEKTAILIEWD